MQVELPDFSCNVGERQNSAITVGNYFATSYNVCMCVCVGCVCMCSPAWGTKTPPPPAAQCGQKRTKENKKHPPYKKIKSTPFPCPPPRKAEPGVNPVPLHNRRVAAALQSGRLSVS